MASKSVAIFLFFNLAVFAFVLANAAPCPSLGACANFLGTNVTVGTAFSSQASSPCCQAIRGLANLDLGVCVCAGIKTGALGSITGANLQVQANLLINACGRNLPTNFVCN